MCLGDLTFTVALSRDLMSSVTGYEPITLRFAFLSIAAQTRTVQARSPQIVRELKDASYVYS
jgi:hypothetical protein